MVRLIIFLTGLALGVTLVYIILVPFAYNKGYIQGHLEGEVTILLDKCIEYETVTEKYWDIQNNVFTGTNTYLKNRTLVDCEKWEAGK